MFFKVFIDIVPKDLENEMNYWSDKNPNIKIHQICISESQGDEGFGVTVIVMYEKLASVEE